MEENHNSKQKKSLVKGFIKNIASLLKYSDFPFFKLRNEFLSLAELALEKGYDDWVGGELIIKKLYGMSMIFCLRFISRYILHKKCLK